MPQESARRPRRAHGDQVLRMLATLNALLDTVPLPRRWRQAAPRAAAAGDPMPPRWREDRNGDCRRTPPVAVHNHVPQAPYPAGPWNREPTRSAGLRGAAERMPPRSERRRGRGGVNSPSGARSRLGRTWRDRPSALTPARATSYVAAGSSPPLIAAPPRVSLRSSSKNRS